MSPLYNDSNVYIKVGKLTCVLLLEMGAQYFNRSFVSPILVGTIIARLNKTRDDFIRSKIKRSRQ